MAKVEEVLPIASLARQPPHFRHAALFRHQGSSLGPKATWSQPSERHRGLRRCLRRGNAGRTRRDGQAGEGCRASATEWCCSSCPRNRCRGRGASRGSRTCLTATRRPLQHGIRGVPETRNRPVETLPVPARSVRVGASTVRIPCEFEGIFNLVGTKTGNTSGRKVLPDPESRFRRPPLPAIVAHRSG